MYIFIYNIIDDYR